MSEARTTISGLKIATVLYDFVVNEALPGTGLDAGTFWEGFAALLGEFSATNKALMGKRDALQEKIDAWHIVHKGQTHDAAAYQAFLEQIGYLLPDPAPFAVDTANVDDEIAHIAGPQLVVPLTNARYALNAANARWGALYPTLYGTDAISEEDGAARTAGFNITRAKKVIARGCALLDASFPLATGSHADAQAYRVKNGHLAVVLPSGETGLRDGAKFAGFNGDASHPKRSC